MQEVKKIIVVCQCYYLYTGLKAIFSSVSQPLISEQAITADAAGKKVSTGKGNLVMVLQESGTPADRIRARASIWHLGHLIRTGIIPQVPCVLLTENLQMEAGGRAFCLTRKWLHEELDILLEVLFARPEYYQPDDGRKDRNLTAQQVTLLKVLQSGQNIKDIAAMLCLSNRAVFAERGTLIRKLGLRNRLELMLLSRLHFNGILYAFLLYLCS